MQARALALRFSRDAFTHAFASDLSRALETATIVLSAHPHVKLQTEERLREFDFGQWEGLTWPEICARWPEVAERASTSARQYTPPGGERFEDVVARVDAFLRHLRTLGDDARVLAVGHAGTLHAALAALRPAGLDPLGVVFSTASYSRFAMEGERARIITLNDVSHLDSIA
jgi:broad specificity phosphatase PhoE